MRTSLYRIILSTLIVWVIFFSTNLITITYAAPPTFWDDFARYLLGKKGNSDNTIYDPETLNISKDNDLRTNIQNVFYPDVSGNWWRLRDIIKVLWVVIFVAMLILQWFLYIMNSDEEEKISKYHINFVYILVGGLIFFWATWILSSGLKLGSTGGTEALIENFDKSLMFQILSGLRAFIFFIAIILLIYTGRKIIAWVDKKERFTAWRRSLLNILVPLLLIKIIDYIFYIAQTSALKQNATDVIVETSKVLWFILWAVFIVVLIYYGFALMFWGSEKQLNKVKGVILAIFLWSLVIFFFLLIIYQLTLEFS